MPRARRPEDDAQRAVMEWLRYQHPEVYRYTIHVPNGGARSKAEAGIFKALGVKAGFPDLICLEPRGPYIGLAVERKAEGARPSSVRPDQVAWLELLREVGWRAEWAAGFSGARAIFSSYIAGSE